MSSAKSRRLLSLGPLAVVALMAMMAVCAPMASAAGDGWTDIPEAEVVDWGEAWGTVIQFQYTGEHAQTITWDFGDGSPRSTEWNPQHTYTEPGTYTIVQYVTNNFEGHSEAWGYYRITIMGKPYVEIITPEGAPEAAKVYATIRTAPVQPDDPVWTGHELVGYFQDPEYTIPFDWSLPIERPVMAYAQFKQSSVTDPGDDKDDKKDEDKAVVGIEEFVSKYGALIVGIAGGLCVVAFALYRHPVVLLIGIALVVVAALLHLGVI